MRLCLLTIAILTGAMGCARKAPTTESATEPLVQATKSKPKQALPKPVEPSPKLTPISSLPSEEEETRNPQPRVPEPDRPLARPTDQRPEFGIKLPPDVVAPPPTAAPAPGQPKPVPGGAVRRVVTARDMADIRLFIDTHSLAHNVMPTFAETLDALQQSKSPAAAGVLDGSIILSGIKKHEGIWAYEADAVRNGGLAVSQNGVETLTAAELTRRIGE